MLEIGAKIRQLRVLHGLTQQELANRCELSKGFISQIEHDQTSPSIATLEDILECLGQDLPGFFNKAPQEKLVFGPEDIFSKQTEAGLIRWLIPSAQKNAMEPILQTLDSGMSTDWDNPHEGEEFGYVISGTVQLQIGQQRQRVRKGESFYFRAEAPHRLSNGGKAQAQILWIRSPPSF